MTARAISILGALGVIAISGCGSSGDKQADTTVAGGADPATVQVIKGWADELRAGDVAAASEHFALPSVVQNGTPPLRLSTRGQVEAFNRSLPCGARLTDAVAVDRFTIATFKLTERPGPGECGSGVGETAKTAFVVRKGLITQWRRVVDADQGTSTSQGPVV
ncbi:MAG TPA: hypothetical protein VH501_10040 [Solirubrobacterales bacterium]